MKGDPLHTQMFEYEIAAETISKQAWLQNWSERTQDALGAEPGLQACAAMGSLDCDEQVVIFERLENGTAARETLAERPDHAALRQRMGQTDMTRSRVRSLRFVDLPDYGWWRRPERHDKRFAAGVAVTLIATRFADDNSRQTYLRLTRDHARYCYLKESGTLIYSAGEACVDSERALGVQSGDLLFVAAFADDASAEKHRVDLAHVKLQEKLVNVPRTRVFVRSYVTTGYGFLWT